MANKILETIDNEIKAAMKAQQAERLSALRMMKAALTHKMTENREKFDDAEAIKTLSTLAKQRRESAEAFRGAGRDEQADKEERELLVVEEFLPVPATEKEIQTAVDEAIAETGASSPKDMGRVMQAAMKRLTGKTVDGKVVSGHVRSALGA